MDTNDSNVYYTYSANQGQSWATPVQVNSWPSVTNEFIWAQGGAAGTVAIAWYGTHAQAGPDSFPSCFNDPGGWPDYKWWGYMGVIPGATTTSATIAQQRFT